MTTSQLLITILIMALGVMLTRFLPFLIFPERKTPPPYIVRLGTVLPYAMTGMLVIYCLKDAFSGAYRGAPELIAVIVVAALQKWKKNILLSIGGGTALYMLLLQCFFS